MTDLVDRLGRTASSVTERGKQWLESAKLRKAMEETQQQRREMLCALGERAYHHMKQGDLTPEHLMPQFKEIQELDLREAVLRRQIEALDAPTSNERACPSCGRPNSPGDRFCVACGGRIEAEAAPRQTCKACGADLKPEARFCVGCGTARLQDT